MSSVLCSRVLCMFCASVCYPSVCALFLRLSAATLVRTIPDANLYCVPRSMCCSASRVSIFVWTLFGECVECVCVWVGGSTPCIVMSCSVSCVLIFV